MLMVGVSIALFAVAGEGLSPEAFPRSQRFELTMSQIMKGAMDVSKPSLGFLAILLIIF